MTPDTIDFNSLSKKQLVELVITKYNDCFRLEEEIENHKQNIMQDELEIIPKLEEENKKLKFEL